MARIHTSSFGFAWAILLCVAVAQGARADVGKWRATDGPYGGHILDLAIDPHDRLYAAAGPAGLFHSPGDGHEWARAETPAALDSVTRVAASAMFVYAHGPSGLYRSSDLQAWTRLDLGYTRPRPSRPWMTVVGEGLGALACVAGSVCVAVDGGGSGDNTMLLRSTDDGDHWQRLSPAIPGGPPRGIASVDGALYVAAAERVYVRDEAARVWRPVHPEGLDEPVTALGSDGATLYAGTAGGGVLRLDRRTRRWTSMASSPLGAAVTRLVARDGAAYAATDVGVFLAEADGQTSRDLPMTRVGEPPTALVVAGGGTLLAGGDNGVWRSRDDGRSWQTAHHGLAARKIGALVVHGGALIARSGDALHRYSPGATSWDSSTPLSPDIRVVGVGAGSLDSLAAGVYGRRVSSHGYDTWAGQFVRQERDLPPVSGAEAFVELRGTLLMATARAVHRLSDDGSSWETLAREVSGPLAVIDDSLFVGDSDGVHRSDDGGFTWRRAVWGLTNRRVSCLAGVGRTLWAGTGAVHQGPRAGIYRSDDLGESWALTTANPWGPDQGPDEVEAFAESDGSVWAYAEGAIWRYGGPHGKWQQLDGGPFDKGIATYRGVLHAVAEGRLLRLDPATLTWEPASSGAPEPLVARASAMWATRDRIYVGTEGQGVQVSTDGGASWAHAGLPKRSVSVLYEYGGVIYAGSPPRGGAQRLRPGAGAWQRLNRGDGRGRQSTSSVVTLGERLYALDRHGLSASGDNGRTWEPVAGPATNVVATRSAYGRIYEATRGDGVHVMEQVGRRWRHSGPVETRVAAQWVTAVGGVVYAGGSDGGVYVDADALRQARHSVGRLRLPRGRVLSAHDGAVVFSAPGGLIRSIDGGFTGARLQKPAATINGGAPRLDSMYVATGDRGVLRYHEGEWTPVNEGLPTLDVRGFARAGSRLYAAAHGAGVFRARERMVGDLLTTTRRRPGRPVHVTLRWEPVGDNAALREVTAIAASETMLYVGIAGGDILASANGGVSWRLTGSLHDGMDPRGMATSGKEWYVATDAGVFKLTAAGQWEGVPLTPPFIHAAAVGDGVAYVLTDSTVYRASAPDGSWERTRYDARGLTHIALLDGSLYASREYGVVLRADLVE